MKLIDRCLRVNRDLNIALMFNLNQRRDLAVSLHRSPLLDLRSSYQTDCSTESDADDFIVDDDDNQRGSRMKPRRKHRGGVPDRLSQTLTRH